MFSKVFAPPSKYFQTARPGLTQPVETPSAKYFGSGGAQRFATRSELTIAFKSLLTITTRQGLVILPFTVAGRETRSTSLLYRSRNGYEIGCACPSAILKVRSPCACNAMPL